MTELWLDDVTGEVYEDESRRYTYGVVIAGQAVPIDVHGETLEEQRGAVAEAMRDQIDAWEQAEATSEQEVPVDAD